MASIKVCLAIGDTQAEEWIMKNTAKKKLPITYTQPAPYRDLILERVSTSMPSVLVLARNLRAGKQSLSLDAIIRKIQMNFSSCRIVLLAGDLKPGDEFLRRTVSRGVYDILTGEQINLNDIIDCIMTPKDYAYAEALQGLEPGPDDERSEVDIYAPEEGPEKNEVMDDDVPIPYMKGHTDDTQAENGHIPSGETQSTRLPQDGTSVLTTPVPRIGISTPDPSPAREGRIQPRGIIFERTGDPEDSIRSASRSTPGEDRTGEPRDTVGEGAVQRSRSSHPVSYDHVLTSRDREMTGKKPLSTGYMPKITVFAGARQGVGCTSAVINTAHALARSGRRVAVVDAVWNEKCIFDRLGLKHISSGFGNRGGGLPKGFQSSFYSSFRDRKGKETGSIQFLEFVQGEVPEDAGVITTISRLSGYDDILIDMSIAYFDKVSVGILSLADKVVAVTLQDTYEMMTLRNYLNVYQTQTPVYSRLVLVINRFSTRLSPTVGDTARYIMAGDIITIPPDTAGFTRANAEKRNYEGKSRVMRAYSFLATKL